MARKIRKVANSKSRGVSFKVSDDFFDLMERERKRFFSATGRNLTQPVLSNLLLRSTKTNINFLSFEDMLNGIKKTRKKK